MLVVVIVNLQKRNRSGNEYADKDVFYRLTVLGAQCNIGAEKYPDAS